MSTTPDTSAARRSEWLRGVLQPCVLQCLADGPAYGYAIIARLAEAGLGEIKGGTLYPLLARLETRELVTVAEIEGLQTRDPRVRFGGEKGAWVPAAEFLKFNPDRV